MNISGNTILITGGGSGIGRALAHALAAEGNRIIVAGRKADALEETARGHEGIATAVLDVADAGAIPAFAAKMAAEHPALNVLINNAGIMVYEDLDAEPYDLATAEAIITTNLLGPIRLTTALLPHLRKQAAATVMTVSSGLAFVPLAPTPTYSATKAAIHSWSDSLRYLLRGTSVEVIELAPPGLRTDLTPGQADKTQYMTLDDYTAEVMTILKAAPGAPEVLVERVKPLRFAEANGNYDAMFGMLNPA